MARLSPCSHTCPAGTCPRERMRRGESEREERGGRWKEGEREREEGRAGDKVCVSE